MRFVTIEPVRVQNLRLQMRSMGGWWMLRLERRFLLQQLQSFAATAARSELGLARACAQAACQDRFLERLH